MRNAGKKARITFRPALVLAACAISLSLGGCKIVHDDQRAKSDRSGSESSFDAAGYVTSVWDSKVVPLFSEKAQDTAAVSTAVQGDLNQAGEKYGHRPATEGSPWSFVVKGEGEVVSVNTESRAGTVVVAVPVGSETREVTLQIGPVVKGSALRDCLPFFTFQSVTNQLEFARVARALNDRAVERIKPIVPTIKVKGKVSFSGAVSLSSASDKFVVVPVNLKTEGGSP